MKKFVSVSVLGMAMCLWPANTIFSDLRSIGRASWEDTAQPGEVLLTEAVVDALKATPLATRCMPSSPESPAHRYWCFTPQRLK